MTACRKPWNKRGPTGSLLNHLRSVMACWTYEANQGDGIMEEHAGVYEEAKAAIAQAEQNVPGEGAVPAPLDRSVLP